MLMPQNAADYTWHEVEFFLRFMIFQSAKYILHVTGWPSAEELLAGKIVALYLLGNKCWKPVLPDLEFLKWTVL